MQPYDDIEEGVKRANALRRTFKRLAHFEEDPDLKEAYEAAARKAKNQANVMFDLWDAILVKEMQDWEARAAVTEKELRDANSLLKRSISELEDDVAQVEEVARAIERLASVALNVAKIAAI